MALDRTPITNLPAIGGLDDVSEARVVLYQSGQLVHLSLLDLVSLVLSVAEGEYLLLSGDEQTTGLDGILIEGDMQAGGEILLLN